MVVSSSSDNYSGHYQPDGEGLEGIARDALEMNGFDLSHATWNYLDFER